MNNIVGVGEFLPGEDDLVLDQAEESDPDGQEAGVRTSIRWTPDELRSLIPAVITFNRAHAGEVVKNKWRTILNNNPGVFNEQRNPGDLQDAWRRIVNGANQRRAARAANAAASRERLERIAAAAAADPIAAANAAVRRQLGIHKIYGSCKEKTACSRAPAGGEGQLLIGGSPVLRTIAKSARLNSPVASSSTSPSYNPAYPSCNATSPSYLSPSASTASQLHMEGGRSANSAGVVSPSVSGGLGVLNYPRLPSGFYFNPSDTQLIQFLELKKNNPVGFKFKYIYEISIYEYHPSDLCQGCERLFFTSMVKQSKSGRMSRIVASGIGYWKQIKSSPCGKGNRKDFTFYLGRPSDNYPEITMWQLQEFSFEDISKTSE